MSDVHNFTKDDADRISSNDQLRSEFVRGLIERSNDRLIANHPQVVPHTLVQFWDDRDAIPSDVAKCLETWAVADEQGIDRVLFDDTSARIFIADHYDEHHVRAFDLCSHPAMRSDYFRLCFIAEHGGLYVDADDEYSGIGLPDLWNSTEMKVQPLCYQISSDSMVVPFEAVTSPSDGLIFYVNNNPIFAPPRHPVVVSALEQATMHLLETDGTNRDIQGLTGPGNLTEALVRHAVNLARDDEPNDFELLRNWDQIASSKWPLDYRDDSRNWRRWVSEGGPQ
jgi:mannosyltransferase OCH1-like enzyme